MAATKSCAANTRSAVGKLGVVLSADRPPRLVVDSSISGVTCHTILPNKAPDPTLQDVRRCLPLDASHARRALRTGS